ncbi:MAG: ShlB/FhaC/HecB family hemolysin secretion/activation protein [Sphingopyxis sp.]|nr:ShlB/FhaC/HecB family hemolysin secretion/activation protein [Sphingopyxis sp.]
MPRATTLLRLCLCGALLSAAPVLAQQSEDLRSILPKPTDPVGRDRDTDASAPELVRSSSASADNASANDAATPSVRIGSVLVETSAAVDHAMFETAIERFLGKDATSQELARLAQEIAEVARTRGMVLASAYVPRQQVELGIVKIILQTGAIDEVRIEGSANRALRELLDPLVGTTIMRDELERRLMLANNIPQIAVDRTELLVEGNRQVLLVKVKERRKLRGSLVADNYGSNNIGPYRARLGVTGVAVFDASDSANVTFRTNPADPEELAAASVSYNLGLDDNGTRAELSAGWSASEIAARGLRPRREARSQYAALSITHPLRRSRTTNLWLDGEFEYLKVEQESLNALLQSDTVVTLSVGVSSSVKVGKGWLRAGVQLRQGLDMLASNRSGDPLSSRRDADGQFTMGRFWTNWSGKVAGDMTMRVAVTGQIASEPLLSSEELGVGGAYSGRGFDFFERSGDQGVLAMAELGYQFDKPLRGIKRLQPYVFLDGGYVHNLRSGFGGGSLMSAGGGLRGDVGPVEFQLEAAVPIHDAGAGTAPDDTKVNFQLGVEF